MDKGVDYHADEGDQNNRMYFSENVRDKFGDAKYKYTMSSRP